MPECVGRDMRKILIADHGLIDDGFRSRGSGLRESPNDNAGSVTILAIALPNDRVAVERRVDHVRVPLITGRCRIDLKDWSRGRSVRRETLGKDPLARLIRPRFLGVFASPHEHEATVIRHRGTRFREMPASRKSLLVGSQRCSIGRESSEVDVALKNV